MTSHTNQSSTPAQVRQLTAARRNYLAETYGWTEPQVDVIRNAICVAATDEELEFFLATCKRLALDPFARQIWFVKRRQKVTDSYGNESWVDIGKPETSIDGFRTIAERSGEYAGQDPIMWCGPDGKWLDVWLKNIPPAAARASIRRKGIDQPFVAVAVFAEHAPYYKRGQDLVLSPMWAKLPSGMIAKCCEALAFRRAFPRDLSGIETDDETQHLAADAATTFTAPAQVAAPAAPALPPASSRPAIDARSEPKTEPVASPQERASAAATAAVNGQKKEAELPAELSADDANVAQDILEAIATAITLDDLRNAVKNHDQKSPAVLATKAAFVGKWNAIAQAERKRGAANPAPKK